MRVRLGGWILLSFVVGSCVVGGCGLLGAKNRAEDAGVGSGAQGPKTFVYVGTKEGTVQTFAFDPVAGLMSRSRHRLEGGVTALGGPVFSPLLLALHADSRVVVSLSIDLGSGALRPAHRMAVGGTLPATLTVDRSGRYVLVPNRGSASVSVLPLTGQSGLRPATTFGASKGAFTLAFHPKAPLVIVGNDTAGTLAHYTFNPGTGVLTPKEGAVMGLPDDARPWRIAWHPQGRTVYVLGAPTATIFVFGFDDRMGTLSRLASDAVPTRAQVDGAAAGTHPPGRETETLGDLKLPPSGLFLYATELEGDRLLTFAVDRETGSLSPAHQVPSGGEDPIALDFDPDARFLFVLNQASRQLATFALDPVTGEPRLVDTDRIEGRPQALHVSTPRLPR